MKLFIRKGGCRGDNSGMDDCDFARAGASARREQASSERAARFVRGMRFCPHAVDLGEGAEDDDVFPGFDEVKRVRRVGKVNVGLVD